MSTTSAESSLYNYFILLKNNTSKGLLLTLGLVATALMCGITYVLQIEWIALALALSFAGVVLITYKPVLWIYIVAASMRFMLHDEEDGLSTVELTLGLFYLITLLFWVFWHTVVKGHKLIKNNADLFLISFLLLLPLTSFISLFNDVPSAQWIRECHHYLFLLYYFPIREYIKDKKSVIIFLVLLGITFSSLSIQNIIAYKRATSDAVYAYQLIFAKSAARVSGLFFPICAAFSFVALAYLKNNYHRIVVGSFAIVNSVAALASMSRTTWVLVILTCCAPFLVARKGNRLFYTGSFVILAFFLFIGISMFGGKNTDLVKKIINKRLSSASKFSDYSYLTRVNENIATWEFIKQYPLGGSGTGAKKLHYDLVVKEHARTSYIHNGYISILYKFGFPLTLIHFMFFIFYTLIAGRIALRYDDHFVRALSLGSLLALIIYYIYNIFGCVFDTRQGIFVTFLIFGFINIAQTLGEQSDKDLLIKGLDNG